MAKEFGGDLLFLHFQKYITMREKLVSVVFLLFLGLTLQAQQFSAVAPSGQTLYFKILDKTKQQAALICPLSYTATNEARRNWTGYSKPAGKVTVPERVMYDGVYYDVVSIEEKAFYHCDGLTSLFLPKTVVELGVTTFEYCQNLAEIRVHPDNPVFDSRNNCNAIIKTEDNGLVYGCKNTVIPNTVTAIHWYAFRGSGLTSISIPPSVEYISSDAFYGCPLTELTIPATVKQLAAGAFEDKVTASLTTTSLKLEAGQYYFSDEYDEDGWAYGVCIVPCGQRKTYENSDWGKYFPFREDCEQYEVGINDEAGCGLTTTVKKAKFGETVRFFCNPGDYDFAIMSGTFNTGIPVKDNSFIMPYYDVTVKATRKQNATGSNSQSKVPALGGKTLEEILSKVVENVTYRFPSGGVHIGESSKEGLCMQVLADGSMFCGNYYTDEQTPSYRMYIVSDPDKYPLNNCPGGWAFVGLEQNNKKHGESGMVFDKNGKMIYYGEFRNDKPVDPYPMAIPEEEAGVFKAVFLNNGDVYIGQLLDNQRAGVGLYVWASGNAWFGFWANDKMNGIGLYMNYDGNYYSGEWENNKKIK